MRADPVRLEVFHQLLAAVCEESGAVLQRSAVSPNIRERRDFSVALFDRAGRLIAQAAHIPVHLGSAAGSVAAVRQQLPPLGPGDVAILNDPYAGGTHLPDVTLVRPVHVPGAGDEPVFYVVNRAHHADIGGAVPGSMAPAHDLHGEGLVLPPLLFRHAGRAVDAVLAVIRANVRSPDERLLDLKAQEASLDVAARRLAALCEEHGLAEVEAYAAHLRVYAERIARDVVRSIPNGTFSAEDVLEDDGSGGGPFPLRLRLTVRDDALDFDFRDSAPQARGGINANPGVVLAAAVYLLRCLCPGRLPTNDGLFQVVHVRTKPGTILDPLRPAPVAGGNVETSQRLVDLGLRALAQALPGRMPACSAGTMVNLTLGGAGTVAFSSYETLPGGAGAGAAGGGVSAIQTHMTNTRNTPVEEFEQRLPVRVHAFTVRRGSGGAGRHRGGDGAVREFELLEPTSVGLFAERAVDGPPGTDGGADGAAFRARVTEPSGRSRSLPAKGAQVLPAGSRVRIETPGGGGHGLPPGR
jgi:N-methylhydantoinase B